MRPDISDSRPGEAPVEIVDYDPSWPAKFEAERARLESILTPWLAGPIEHVGSTAIPDMPAKPVIDIMAAIVSLDASRPAIAELPKLGYVYFPYRTEVMHWFCKPSANFRTHHLHLVPFPSRRWTDSISFRDALLRNHELAAEYAALKRTLAREFKFDREAYTEAKAPFIQRMLQKTKGN